MSTGNKHFDQLVKDGKPVGEVIAIERFLVRVRGLQPCPVHSLVMFEDGGKGFVHQVLEDHVLIFQLSPKTLSVGTMAVLQHDELVSKIGKDFVGRAVSVTGEPLDGKGPIAADGVWPVFNTAPPLHDRRVLEDQLESGVCAIDSLFPLVRGQRMALLGDSKSGKSSLVSQIAINQKNTDQIVVYCLIAKRRSDVDTLLTRLKENGSLEKAIVVVATMFESPVMSFLAPYVACSMAEYLWQKCDQDTIIIYDDLTSHAHIYREISLLAGASPGRDSYPGDMFYVHSSLLERAGRLSKSGKCLTAVPVVHTANGDITAYLPTNIMSITDGQWILDMETFRSGVRPAINMGLSVTRTGGVGHNQRQKALAAKTLKILADYRQADEFSHFGAELAVEARQVLAAGKRIFTVITQSPSETFSLMSQQMMFDLVLNLRPSEGLDINLMKANVAAYAAKVAKDTDYEAMRDQLKAKCIIKLEAAKKPAAPASPPAAPAPAPSSKTDKPAEVKK